MIDISNVSKDTFCIGPWVSLRIRPTGLIYYCHASLGPYNDDPGATDNIQDIDLDHYYSSATPQYAQNELLQGHHIKGCTLCYNIEKKVEFSHRQRYNIQKAIFTGKHFKKSFEESTIQDRFTQKNIKPMFYNISVSNLCNLGCVMCNEDWSSRLATDLKKINVKQGLQLVNNSTVDWSRDEQVWQKFLTHILNNKEKFLVHFQGGEPMLHKRFIEFVDKCVESNDTDFHLTVVSNGTVYNDDLVEKFSKFKSFQVEISTENLSPSNEYIRYPIKNTELKTNIEKFLQHRNDRFDIVIRTVPQLLSVLDYTSLLEFCLDNQLTIESNCIENPIYLKPNLLPDNIKKIAIDRLQSFQSKLVEQKIGYINSNIRNKEFLHQTLSDNINLVISQINEPVIGSVDDLRSQAVKYFRDLESLRGNNIIKQCPELEDFILSYE